MKKVLVLFMMFTVIFSCKDNQKNESEASSENEAAVTEDGKTLKQSDGLIAIQGKFLYDEKQNAAVLLTPNKMYGIIVDDKMHELNKQVQQYKKELSDMVPVTMRGRVFKKEPDAEGWEDIIEIKEILKVSEPKPEENDVIKLGSK